MHILMPAWLAHSAPGGARRQGSAGAAGAPGPGNGDRPAAAPMFSIDIQPHGERLATAGQDASVNIWSLPVLQRLAAAEGRNRGGSGGTVAKKTPRAADLQPPPGAHLARITGHSRSCNCVRWSPSGSLLASGGDDMTVLIYEQGGAEVRSKAFGGGEEDWIVRKPLRGHNGDVTDICWSPDGELLASASVDNTIGIWSVRGAQLVTLLKGHTALVKGVAWDPVGRFVASQSDDRTTIVWRTSDWGIEKRLTEPFAAAVYKANANVYFQRCSWSPCGTQLLATNGLKEPQSDIAPMFTRASSFKEYIDLVGHRQPVVSTKFSARLYRRQRAAASSGAGTANGNGTAPAAAEPAASAPYTCMALGSKDGWVTVWKAGGTRPFVVFRDVFDHDVIDVSWGSDGYTFVACSSDGKVLYVSFTPDELGDVVPYEEERQLLADLWRKFGGTNGGTALVETPTQLVMEKTRRLSAHAAPSSGVRKQENGRAANSFAQKSPLDIAIQQQALPVAMSAAVLPTSAHAVAPTPPANAALLASQREGKGKSGKRRIIPAAVGSDGGSMPSSLPGPFEVPSPAAKRVRQDPVAITVPPAPRPFLNQGRVETGSAANAFGAPSEFVAPSPPLYKPSVIGLSMMLLPSEKGGAAVARAIDTQSPPTLLEAKEQHGGSSRASGHMVSCSRGEKILWRDYYPLLSPVALLAGSAQNFVAVGTADGMLYLYSAISGRRLLPPIALDSAPHLLEAHTVGERWFALVVSRSGLCSVYDVKAKKLVCARSAAPLLARPVDSKGETPETEDGATRAETYRSISMGRVTDQGEPLLILSDCHVFFYSRDLCSWLRVADDTAPNSEFTRGTTDVPARAGLLRSLQASAASSRRAPTLSGMGDLRRSAVETLAHLETLLESSIALSSAEDYRYYLANYATKLATAAEDDVESSDQRLRELCNSLLCVGAKRMDDVLILGMNRRSLLNDVVLPIVGEQTVMQRLVAEFLDSLAASEKRFQSLPSKH